MASIPASVILVWTGSHASIPAGWSRETTLDAKHAKAWGAENPDATGGATTHTHTSPTHSHALNAHTHTYSLPSAGTTSSGMGTGAGGQQAIIDTHTHTGTSGALSGGTTTSDAVTYGSVSNDPPYRKVIFIKAAAGAQLATNIVALFNSNTPPANWSNVTELSGRYMVGAGTGADADLTTDNGSSTNSHGITHTHTAQTHTHSAANSNASGDTRGGESNENTVIYTHVHSVSLAAGTQAINQNTDTLVTAETVEPAYAILQAIKKGASGLKAVGIIGLWLGTAASIPDGWVLCDGTNSTKDLRDKFIKVGDPAGANGGANTHTHAAQAHSHTGNGTHNDHTGTAAAHAAAGTIAAGASSATHRTDPGSSHAVASIQAVTANYAAANTTADSSANQPAYRTAAYIEFQKETYGGAFLYNFC